MTKRLFALASLGAFALAAAGACSSKSDDASSNAAPNAAAGAAGSAGAPATSGAGGEAAGTGGSSGAGGAAGSAGSMVPPDWDKTVTPLPDDQATSMRASCAFAAGALPAETLGDKARYGKHIPVDHVVLVMMENRSFDHYLQKLKEVAPQMDVDVAPADFANPSGTGKSIPIHPLSDGPYCLDDLEHGWAAVHQEVGAKLDMQGFVIANEVSGDGARAMTYQTPDTAPFGYFLSQTFAMSDRYFCSLLGPTWPNRMYFYAASSFGLTANTLVADTHPTLLDELSTRGVEWRVYHQDTPGTAEFPQLLVNNTESYKPLQTFYDDAKSGNLPPFAYVDPGLVGNAAKQTSQHPPANHEYGEQFLWDVVSAVTQSPEWGSTALFITYDEHGGFYDHVPPPPACKPDASAPVQGASLGDFDRLGVRVPVWVVSPFAKKQYVSHVVHDHASIVRFVETRFTVPALSARDANADAMLDLFDFDAPPFATPPALPARPTITAAKDTECKQLFP